MKMSNIMNIVFFILPEGKPAQVRPEAHVYLIDSRNNHDPHPGALLGPRGQATGLI
jgi:hypothetical protein